MLTEIKTQPLIYEKEVQAFPLPEELTLSILSKLSFCDLVKLGPVCKNFQRFKLELLKKAPIAFKLALKLHKLSKVKMEKSTQCVGGLIPNCLEECKVPWRKENIYSIGFPFTINQKLFQELNSSFFRVLDQTRMTYFTLLVKNKDNSSTIITLYPSTKDRWMIYTLPHNAFGENNWMCTQEIIGEISQILLNKHPKYKISYEFS